VTLAPAEAEALIIELASYSYDPVGFVMWAFPWGEPGTELASATGPEPWQRQILTELGEGILSVDEAVQLARASGHGIGKSCVVAWIILWAFSTFEDTRGVVTANTEAQLKTKTWVEVAKWFRLFLAKELFKITATALFSRDPDHEREWRIDMVPWSEKNTEAFAGLHNAGKRILVVFDEASAIPDIIWETTEGALTDRDTQIIWCAFGNPTRNVGRFRECFEGGKFAHRWHSMAIDSRDVSITNKVQIARWVADFGEDSDFVRIRVRGVFPRIDASAFISYEIACEAVTRTIVPQRGLPLVLGVDVGRFGDDPSVIYPRKGRDARSIPPQVFFGLSTMQLVSRIISTYDAYHAEMILVDGGGVGGGVIDRLRELRYPVIDVQFGGKADGTTTGESGVKYLNKRAEIWGAMREWLAGGAIVEYVNGLPGHSLIDELITPTYSFNQRDQIVLESKAEMRRRGEASPNVADALAITFAMPFAPAALRPKQSMRADSDYDPYDEKHLFGEYT